MTTHTSTRRPVTQPADGHYINRDHTVTGTLDQLANIVANHRNVGTLVALTAPRPAGDRFQVILRLREYQPSRPTVRVNSVGEHARTRIRARRSGKRTAAIITAIISTVAGLVAVAAYLIGQLVELIAAHAALIIGASAVFGLLACVLGARACPGLHCSGCKHH